MKKNYTLLIIALLSLPILAMAGDAGVPNYVTWIATVIAFIVGLFIPATGQAKFVIIKTSILGIIKLLDELLEARHPDSPGGKNITDEEWKDVIFPTLETIGNNLKGLLKK